ncbi:putative cytochrome P450 [Penicillium brasilianum]|uniref:Putative cytochrome P450 n=1 Tax=Penicillium brasilianum TaxID=104259 RepID=A0A1S9RT10_PENBI|nr:putative cytochrome P450 [Penicillium brasilianum]
MWESTDKQQALPILVLGISVVLITHLVYTYRKLRHIPGPLIAKFTDLHRFFLARNRLIHLYQSLAHQRYGPAVRFGPNLVSICDPEAIQTIFSLRGGFPKSKMYRAFRPWTPEGLLLSVFTAEDDATNRQMKKHISVYYSLSWAVSTFEERIDNAIKMFFDELDCQFIATGSHIDLTNWLKFFSYDSMGMMTFSRPYGYLKHGNDVHGIMASVKRANLVIAPMTQVPWLDWLLHKNDLINRIMPEAIAPLMSYIKRRISERQDKLWKGQKRLQNAKSDGPCADNDFLGYYLQAHEKKSENIPIKFVFTWAFANILGGADSTAAMLRSVVCFLVEHPDALETVRNELREQQRTDIGLSLPIPKWNELQNLPFLDACIKESLRLDPPFSMPLERVVPAEGAVICGQFYPGGTIVGMSPYITNRYRPTWGDDADLWRPSRWLEGENSHIRKLEAALLSFGAGTRGCLGQHVALFEIKKLVTALFMNYDIDLVEPRPKFNRSLSGIHGTL